MQKVAKVAGYAARGSGFYGIIPQNGTTDCLSCILEVAQNREKRAKNASSNELQKSSGVFYR